MIVGITFPAGDLAVIQAAPGFVILRCIRVPILGDVNTGINWPFNDRRSNHVFILTPHLRGVTLASRPGYARSDPRHLSSSPQFRPKTGFLRRRKPAFPWCRWRNTLQTMPDIRDLSARLSY